MGGNRVTKMSAIMKFHFPDKDYRSSFLLSEHQLNLFNESDSLKNCVVDVLHV